MGDTSTRSGNGQWGHGCGDPFVMIAGPGCSDRTIRHRVREWADAGLVERLHALVLKHYDRLIGLRLTDLSVDGCITKAPGGAKAGRCLAQIIMVTPHLRRRCMG